MQFSPANPNKAVKIPEWKAVMEKEFCMLKKNETQMLVDKSIGKQETDVKWKINWQKYLPIHCKKEDMKCLKKIS